MLINTTVFVKHKTYVSWAQSLCWLNKTFVFTSINTVHFSMQITKDNRIPDGSSYRAGGGTEALIAQTKFVAWPRECCWLATCHYFCSFRHDGFADFDRPFTSQTWLGSARNFGKTRFRQFRTFDFSTPNFFFVKSFGRKILFFCWFCVDWGRPRRNGHQNQLPGQISLKIDLFWSLSDQKWCQNKILPCRMRARRLQK